MAFLSCWASLSYHASDVISTITSRYLRSLPSNKIPLHNRTHLLLPILYQFLFMIVFDDRLFLFDAFDMIFIIDAHGYLMMIILFDILREVFDARWLYTRDVTPTLRRLPAVALRKVGGQAARQYARALGHACAIALEHSHAAFSPRAAPGS